MTSRAESDITRPLRVLFSNVLFTAQDGRAITLLHVNLIFLPPFGTTAHPYPGSADKQVAAEMVA